jgi:hypothetical protein
MSDPRFFGYGSLVNLRTHDFDDPRPARLIGWQRVWRHTSRRPVAYLSVEPCEGSEIDGIVARVPGGDWAALDRREANYRRRDVTGSVLHDAPQVSTAVYEVSGGHIADPSLRHPILLSYIDVVIQGFVQMHGQDGAARFFATTRGWAAPILDDRAAPRYPRHQLLTASERDLVDAALARMGCTILPPEAN